MTISPTSANMATVDRALDLLDRTVEVMERRPWLLAVAIGTPILWIVATIVTGWPR